MNTETEPPQLLHGVQEIADFLGVRRRQAQHWIDTEQIPHFRIGRSICGNRVSIAAAMRAREAEAMKPKVATDD